MRRGFELSELLGHRIFSAYGTSLLAVFSGLLINFRLLRKITQEFPPAPSVFMLWRCKSPPI